MAPPEGHELVTIDDKKYQRVREGLASILTPRKEPTSSEKTSKGSNEARHGQQQVFYNPVQQFNRDLSVLAILIYGESIQSSKRETFEKRNQGWVNKRKKKKARQQHSPSDKGDQADRSHSQTAASAVEAGFANGDNTTTNDTASGPRESVPKTKPLESDDIHSTAQKTENGGVKRKRSEGGSDPGVIYNERAEDSHKKQRTENVSLNDNRHGKEQLEGGPRRGDLITSELETERVTGRTSVTNADGPPPNEPGKDAEQKRMNGDNTKPKPLPFSILDALSATGLRAIRYAKEIPFATHIIANDVSADAIKAINLNVDHNEIQNVVQAHVGDARAYMYQKAANEGDTNSDRHVHRFDVIDLDPYGTAAPFFDAALQALKDDGLLCVTCTDAGVWASNGYPEKSFGLYGGIPVKGYHSHEGGLRLILHAIATTAARYGIAIEPLLSLSIDFYARLFIRIHKRQADVKLLASKTMLVYSCDHGCGAWTTQRSVRSTQQEARNGEVYFKHSFAQGPTSTPNCKHCGFKTHLAGPMWAGPLHNPYFIQRILDRLPSLDNETYSTTSRIEGMLTLALEEDLELHAIPDDATSSLPQPQPQTIPLPSSAAIPATPPAASDRYPFFINLSYLSRVLHCSTPPEDAFRGALRHLGYRVTRSHCKASSIRTDAPWSVLWEVMREWVRTKSPIKEGAVKEGTAGYEILRRTRDTEGRRVEDMKDVIEERLKGARSKADLKSELEAALFRLGAEADDEVSSRDDDARKAGKCEIVFDEQLGKEKFKKRMVRYQINPTPNWGPMNRATGAARSDVEKE